jgi:hypothetical protein
MPPKETAGKYNRSKDFNLKTTKMKKLPKIYSTTTKNLGELTEINYVNACLSSGTLIMDDIIENIDNGLPEEFTPRELINSYKKAKTQTQKDKISQDIFVFLNRIAPEGTIFRASEEVFSDFGFYEKDM